MTRARLDDESFRSPRACRDSRNEREAVSVAVLMLKEAWWRVTAWLLWCIRFIESGALCVHGATFMSPKETTKKKFKPVQRFTFTEVSSRAPLQKWCHYPLPGLFPSRWRLRDHGLGTIQQGPVQSWLLRCRRSCWTSPIKPGTCSRLTHMHASRSPAVAISYSVLPSHIRLGPRLVIVCRRITVWNWTFRSRYCLQIIFSLRIELNICWQSNWQKHGLDIVEFLQLFTNHPSVTRSM